MRVAAGVTPADLAEPVGHGLVAGLVHSIDAIGALRPGLDRQQALDRAWRLTGPDLYFRANDGCGWSDQDYERWLSELLKTDLLTPRR